MRAVLSSIFGVALLIPGTAMGEFLFGPVVHIVAVDLVAYEDPNLPEWGIQTRQTPSRKAAFQVWRSGSASRALTVNYSVGGSASNGVDYAALSGEVTIPAGSRFARILVRPIDDNDVEQGFVGTNYISSETVVLTLQPSSAYKLNFLRRARVFIIDDDRLIAVPPPFSMPIFQPGTGVTVVDFMKDQRDAVDPDFLRRIIDDLGPQPQRELRLPPRDLRQR